MAIGGIIHMQIPNTQPGMSLLGGLQVCSAELMIPSVVQSHIGDKLLPARTPARGRQKKSDLSGRDGDLGVRLQQCAISQLCKGLRGPSDTAQGDPGGEGDINDDLLVFGLGLTPHAD